VVLYGWGGQIDLWNEDVLEVKSILFYQTCNCHEERSLSWGPGPFKVLGYYRCNFGFLMFMKNSSFWIPDVKPMCSS